MKNLYMIFVTTLCCISIFGSENQGELIKQQRKEKAEKKQQELRSRLAQRHSVAIKVTNPLTGERSTIAHSPIGNMVDTKQEVEKEVSASSWSRFKGCKNKKECGTEDEYCNTYSAEGFCDGCNFKFYPERYFACLFCRQPKLIITQADMSNSDCCGWDVQTLLINKLKRPGQEEASGWKYTSDWRYAAALPSNIRLVIKNSAKTMAVNSIAALKVFDLRFATFCRKNKGPHFYYGAFYHKDEDDGRESKVHIWVNDFDLDEKDKNHIEYAGDSESALESLFEKYNLFGPVTGYNIGNKSPKYISAIYEEMIDKK